MAWKDQMQQPRDQMEKSNVAAEVLGGKTKGNVSRAPRFHRMSIASAENGVTIDHTMKVPIKRGNTTASGERHGSTLPTSGPDGDGMEHKSSQFVFGHDHPIMTHIHAIHKHMAGTAGNDDFDGDSD